MCKNIGAEEKYLKLFMPQARKGRSADSLTTLIMFVYIVKWYLSYLKSYLCGVKNEIR